MRCSAGAREFKTNIIQTRGTVALTSAISAIKMVNVKSCVFADGLNFHSKVGHDCVKLSLVVCSCLGEGRGGSHGFN